MMNPGANPLNPPDGRIEPQMRNQYKFSAEELRVLKECNKDSFYQRCLPISAVLAGSTFYAVKNSILNPNPRFGATPKVIVAVVIGYFIGKISYQSKCAEKLMQLPNSQVGEMLRKKRRGNITETLDPSFGAGMSLTPFSGMSSSDTYSDNNPNNSLDLDTDRPDAPGLEENNRPSVDNPAFEDEMPPEQKHVTSYDELRKKNREEFQQKRLGGYKESVRTAPVSLQRSQVDADGSVTPPKNKYGDVWG